MILELLERSALARAVLVPATGFLTGIAFFVVTTPVSGVLYQPRLLPDTVPLAVAGAEPLIAVASIGMGLNWLYLTGVSTVFLVLATLSAGSGLRGGMTIGLLLGMGGSMTLVTVTACACASGSTAYLFEFLV